MKPNGVTYYLQGEIPLPVYFPEGDVSCIHCRCCVKDPTYGRRVICMATGRELVRPEDGIGPECPLIMKEEPHV